MANYDDAAFRAQFPEFADATAYPAATISLYFDTATIFIGENGSPCAALQGKSLQAALNYLTAHLLVLSQQQATSGPAGSSQGGYEVSASIGEISVSKLSPPAKDAWAFWLYQTNYGQSLMALLEVLAVGGFSVGGMSESSSFRRAGGVFW